MQNTLNGISNYGLDYTTNQLFLPLDLSVSFPPDDLVFAFVEILKGVNLHKYFESSHPNQKDRFALLYAVLFAFADQKHPSLRTMERLCKTDIRYIWLSKELYPSHMAFQRLINEDLMISVKDIFYDINQYLIQTEDIDLNRLFIDGTKIEAYARKTSFVWKKAVLNYQKRLYVKMSKTIKQMNEEILYLLPFEVKEKYTLEDLRVLINYLELLCHRNEVQFVYGKGKRKSNYQKYYEQMVQYEEKLLEYEIHLKICGDRNSYSKTDHDATFMNMKYDYYNRTGVFKPGYNLQIGVCEEYIMHLGLYPNPTDTKTFIPFMEGFYERYKKYPLNPVGDAGYGSYDNYMYCLEKGMKLTLKYNYFDKKNYDKKFKKKIYHSMNFPRNESGYKVCPAGHAFDQYQGDTYDSRSGRYLKITQNYTTGKCSECEIKRQCTKAKGDRTLRENVILNELQEEADRQLTSEEGQALRKMRSYMVEGCFGVLKEDDGFERYNRRGQEKVETESYLVAIGYNIRKYYHKKQRLLIS